MITHILIAVICFLGGVMVGVIWQAISDGRDEDVRRRDRLYGGEYHD